MEFQSGAVRPVESISEGWNLIKDTYWMYVLMIFVAVVILIGVQLIFNLVNSGITVAISAVLGIATQDSGDVGRASASIVPQLISMVIGFFTSIIVVTLSGSLYCGIFMSLSRTANTNTAEFSDLFAGFQKIKECLIFAVLMSAIQFIIGLVMLLGFAAVGVSAYGLRDLLIKDGELNPAAFGGLFLVIFVFIIFSIIVNLIISSLTAFVYPLIAERNLSGGEAVMLSAKSGLANIGGIILLLILMGLMAFGGALVCGIGILFVAPLIVAATFTAYRSVFGVMQSNYQQNPPPPPYFGNQPGY